MCGSLVRQRSSTNTNPRSRSLTFVVSSPSESLTARRPTDTRTRSNAWASCPSIAASIVSPTALSAVTLVFRWMAEKRARRDDGVLEADHLRLVAAYTDGPRVLEGAAATDDLHALGLGHGGEPP